jgi:O-antigen/teichoic acid export membrane protein
MQQPFRNILRLSLGDFLAKTLNFLVFIHLARVLGVAHYGVLEFALSILAYFLVIDGGLELWATREVAQGSEIRQLAARIVPLRCLVALGSFGALLLLLPAFPDYPALTTLLVLFGPALFTQAVSLKWVFMGQEKMVFVAGGLVIAQIVFAAAVFAFVRSPEWIVWVPVLRLLGEVVMAAYFLRLFVVTYGGLPRPLTLRGAAGVIRPALVMGSSHGLAMMSYNFDSVLLGFLIGPTAVGLYNAAYKPITAALAMPVTFYLGLFPALARTFAESMEEFRQVVVSSLRVTSIFALPLGVLGSFFSAPIIDLLFGPAYANSVPALQVLSWSAVLVTLRGTYKQGLNAAGRAELDLRCAELAVILNVSLNLLLIPRYGILGAALATLAAEALWLITAAWYFNRYVMRVNLHSVLLRPLVASGFIVGCLSLLQVSFWGVQAWVGMVLYLGTLFLLNRTEVWSFKAKWPRAGKEMNEPAVCNRVGDSFQSSPPP